MSQKQFLQEDQVEQSLALGAHLVEYLSARLVCVSQQFVHGSSYLASELASRADDQHKRLSTNAIRERVVADGVGTRGSELTSLAHELGQDGD
jgi:hypothetical protein